MDVFLTRLRKHLRADPSVQILTVHGRGVKLLVTQR
jgi:DNA-binding response OmpR family regulator